MLINKIIDTFNTPAIKTLFFILLVVFCLEIAFTFLYLFYINNRERNRKQKRASIEDFITNAILFSDEEMNSQIPMLLAYAAKLRTRFAKQFVLEELLTTKKNLSGTASRNSKFLYEQLSLNTYSMAKLDSWSWHDKVKGIQELAIMEQTSALNVIYQFVNHKNESVRSEAQTAILKLAGFEGLGTVNMTVYPITEWQQMIMLEQLHKLSQDNINNIPNLLKSTNSTVVVFVLKVIRKYQLIELRPQVEECLRHGNTSVKIEAIRCLQLIYDESTPAVLIDSYKKSTDKRYQAIVFNALEGMITKEDMPFVLAQFDSGSNEIKLAAARILFKNNELALMESKPYANLHPWKEIIMQVKNDKV